MTARADMTWQDIATVPKDGTPILLHYGGKLGVRYGYWDHIGTADFWIADASDDLTSGGWICPYQEDDLDPTHWMHLPAPPESI
jgi:hypothetical protein